MSKTNKIKKIIGYILIFLPFVYILRNYIIYTGEPNFYKSSLSDYLSLIPIVSPFFLISIVGISIARPFKDMEKTKQWFGFAFLSLPLFIIIYSLSFLPANRSAGWEQIYLIILGVPSSIIYSIIAMFWIKFRKHNTIFKLLLLFVIIVLHITAIILLLQVDVMIE